jgi:hypothetical protein
MELSQTVVLHKLDIAHRPVEDRGRIVFEDNPARTPYIVFDNHRDAPVGFGVKVGGTKKTYVLQRRVGGADYLECWVQQGRAQQSVDVGIAESIASDDERRLRARHELREASRSSPTRRHVREPWSLAR